MKKYTIPVCKNCDSGELTVIPDNFGLVTWSIDSDKRIEVEVDNILPVSVFGCEECGYVELKLLGEK